MSFFFLCLWKKNITPVALWVSFFFLSSCVVVESVLRGFPASFFHTSFNNSLSFFFVKRLLVDPVSFWQWEASHWTVEWNKHQPQLRVKGACVCKLHFFIFPVFFRQKEHSHSPARPSAVCSCDVNGKLLQVRVLLAAWVLCGSFHSWSFLFDGSLFFLLGMSGASEGEHSTGSQVCKNWAFTFLFSIRVDAVGRTLQHDTTGEEGRQQSKKTRIVCFCFKCFFSSTVAAANTPHPVHNGGLVSLFCMCFLKCGMLKVPESGG